MPQIADNNGKLRREYHGNQFGQEDLRVQPGEQVEGTATWTS